MGTVYLARATDGASDSTVAIKVLHPHLASDGDMVAMFLDEARIATRFRHANLVRVRDVDLVRDELSIVMDYVEGTTLGSLQRIYRKRGERLALGLSARVVGDALMGLQAMHDMVDDHGAALGLVHRDVSPQNLLIGTDGVTRVADFGVALAAGRLASTRPDGTVKGKLQYLAPEQIGRKPLDRRVDVFAAGIVLWECLTGERLFDAATEAETVTRVLRDPVAPPSSLRPEVPTALDEVCLRALERDPCRRFANAADFAGALRDAVDDVWSAEQVGALVAQVAAEPIRRQREALRRRPRFAPRARAWIGLVSGAVLLLAGGAAALRLLPLGGRQVPIPVAHAEGPAQLAPSPPMAPDVPDVPSGSAAGVVRDRTPTPLAADPPAPILPRPAPSAARLSPTRRPHVETPAATRDSGAAAPSAKRPVAPEKPFMPNEL